MAGEKIHCLSQGKMFDWQTSELGHLAHFIDYRGKTPPKQSFGIPLVTAKIIKNNAIQNPQEFIASDFYDKWMTRGIPKKGDVIFTTEAPLGEVAIIKTSKKLAFAQRIIILQANPKILNNDFLFYALQHTQIKNRIDAKSSGTTVFGIKSSELKKVEIDYPCLKEQQAIAATLSCLDDKIELNNKINANLEAQAQAIFKSWFVDFEPWGGVIPNNWREGTLSNICSYSRERIPVSALTLETYISTENMSPNRGGFTHAASLPLISMTTTFAPGDILVSNIRPYFKKIIYCSFVGGCSTDVLCFRPNNDNLSLYIYNTLYSDSFFDYMVAGSKGTKMPRGDKQQVMQYHVMIPTEDVLDNFTNAVEPMIKKRLLLTKESAHLTAIRDALLPHLMSGKISPGLGEFRQ